MTIEKWEKMLNDLTGIAVTLDDHHEYDVLSSIEEARSKIKKEISNLKELEEYER